MTFLISAEVSLSRGFEPPTPRCFNLAPRLGGRLGVLVNVSLKIISLLAEALLLFLPYVSGFILVIVS